MLGAVLWAHIVLGPGAKVPKIIDACSAAADTDIFNLFSSAWAKLKCIRVASSAACVNNFGHFGSRAEHHMGP